jgi:ribosomal protein S18 acetylase RimI-like enzyme
MDSDLESLCSVRRLAMDPHLNEAGVFVTDQRNRELISWRFDSVSLILLGNRELPVGYVKLIREPPAWYLAQIAVLPSHQGKGIGTRVIRQIIREADVARIPVSISVFKNNARARRIYENLGFEKIGEDEREHFLQWTPGRVQQRA